MQTWTPLAALAAVYLPVLASPGPNFLAVTRASLDLPRRHALATALGVASGSTLLAALAAAGVGLLLRSSGGWLELLGAGYLLLAAWSIWRQASRVPAAAADPAQPAGTAATGYRTGLLTNLSNPKALVFFSTIFAALLGAQAPQGLRVMAVATVGTLSTAWHLSLATLFAQPAMRRGYALARPAVLRLSALLFTGFALRLLWQALRPR